MFGSTFYNKQGEENLLIHEDLRMKSQIYHSFSSFGNNGVQNICINYFVAPFMDMH